MALLGTVDWIVEMLQFMLNIVKQYFPVLNYCLLLVANFFSQAIEGDSQMLC